MTTYHLTCMGSIKKPARLANLDLVLDHEVTVQDLVSFLLDRGETIGHREDYPADPLDNLLIIVNGSTIRGLDGPNTLLRDNDSVAILVPLFGG